MVVIKPVSMPKPSLIKTWTSGARQLVVQEALETMWSLAVSYSPSLTPMTMVLTSPLPGAEMRLGFLAVGKEAGGFDDDVHAERLPRQRGEVFDRADAFDLVAVDDDDVGFFEGGIAFFRDDGVLELAVDGIVSHLVGEIIGVGGHVHDGDDVNRLAEETLITERLKDHPADAAESVDSYFYCHSFILCFGGNNFRKPMRDFSRERPPVNEELGNNLAKTLPILALDRRPVRATPAKADKSFAIHA